MKTTICLLVLLAAAATATAQMYKWKDANGAVQYSDTPPPSNAKDVQQLRRGASAPASPSAGAAQTKPVADAEAEFRKRLTARQDAEAKQAKAQEEEQVRAANCERARSQLSAVESGNRIGRYTESGERVTLDDNERERLKADAQKAIQVWCK